jgi:hypothetical protein
LTHSNPIGLFQQRRQLAGATTGIQFVQDGLRTDDYSVHTLEQIQLPDPLQRNQRVPLFGAEFVRIPFEKHRLLAYISIGVRPIRTRQKTFSKGSGFGNPV